MTLIEHIERFSTESACRAYLEKIRFPNSSACVRCGSVRIWRYKRRFEYLCGDCNYHFSVTAGTIFHNSHVKLTKWFYAIHLLTNVKKGISALHLGREIGVTYKTAWYMSNRIREAMIEGVAANLKGIVEVDEIYIGSRLGQRGKN